jgi:hypothetical protein
VHFTPHCKNQQYWWAMHERARTALSVATCEACRPIPSTSHILQLHTLVSTHSVNVETDVDVAVSLLYSGMQVREVLFGITDPSRLDVQYPTDRLEEHEHRMMHAIRTLGPRAILLAGIPHRHLCILDDNGKPAASARDALACGIPVPSLLEAGYTAYHLRAAAVPATTLLVAGFAEADVLSAGWWRGDTIEERNTLLQRSIGIEELAEFTIMIDNQLDISVTRDTWDETNYIPAIATRILIQYIQQKQRNPVEDEDEKENENTIVIPEKLALNAANLLCNAAHDDEDLRFARNCMDKGAQNARLLHDGVASYVFDILSNDICFADRAVEVVRTCIAAAACPDVTDTVACNALRCVGTVIKSFDVVSDVVPEDCLSTVLDIGTVRYENVPVTYDIHYFVMAIASTVCASGGYSVPGPHAAYLRNVLSDDGACDATRRRAALLFACLQTSTTSTCASSCTCIRVPKQNNV